VQKVLTKHFKTLILKVAFVIIRRLQKPHYSQKQKSNKNKKQQKDSGSIVTLLKALKVTNITEFGVLFIKNLKQNLKNKISEDTIRKLVVFFYLFPI